MTSIQHQGDDRYARQKQFTPIGPQGQSRLGNSTVVLIGCGALGSVSAGILVRAGIKRLDLIDRDFLELSNLQRQMLFDQQDIKDGLPKAVAAARKLKQINSNVEVNPIVADVDHETIESFIAPADVILDGLDNLHTRFILNDAAVKHSIPWIYGAALAGRGMAMVIPAGGKPCLRCLLDTPPAPGEMDTCQTAGILASTVAMVASFQAAEAIKILTGNTQATNPRFFHFDLWKNHFAQSGLEDLKKGCPCCAGGEYDYLKGLGSLRTISFCGKDSIQVRPRQTHELSLEDLARKLSPLGPVMQNEYMLRFTLKQKQPPIQITVFPDARAIIDGISDTRLARSLYAQYIGH